MIEREVSPSLMLKAKLQALGRRIIAIAFFERFGVFMLALVLGSVLLATVDWFFELSLGFRTASLSLLSLGLAVLAANVAVRASTFADPLRFKVPGTTRIAVEIHGSSKV